MKASTALVMATMSMLVSMAVCSTANSPTSKAPTADATTPTGTTSPAQLIKVEFLLQAKEICHKTNLQIQQVPRGGDPASQNAGEKAIVGLVQHEIAQLKGLGYPPGDLSTLEPIYNGALGAVATGGPGAIAPWGIKLTAYGLDCGSQ
jgi:hypothetical protein